MKRNMEKTAERAKKNIPEYYDLTYKDIYDLLEKSTKDRGQAILTAFEYGFVLGHRATLAGKVTKRL